MKRAITAAMLWTFLVPLGALAQEAEAPAAEPEPSGADVAPPRLNAPDAGKDQVSETYTVRTGDTLWDLSQRFLGNPWYWPKVWSYNPEIENPHWIYPGNVIRFYPSTDEAPAQVEPAEPAPAGELGEVTMGNLKTAERFGQDDDIVAVTKGIRIGYVPPRRSFLRQDGLITRAELDDAGVIERAWAEKEMLSTYDKVYLRYKNKASVRLGERYTIFRTGREVIHPVTGQKVGYLTRIVGTLRVQALGEGMVSGIIEHTLDDIQRGDFVGPLGNFDRQVIAKEATAQIQGVILASLVPHLPFMGENHVVFIDKGSKDGVEEGNLFTVVRRGDPLFPEGENPRRYPAEDVATMVVVDVKETASAALVVRSIRELEVGERVITRTAAAHASAAP